jgi:hypothetical protein
MVRGNRPPVKQKYGDKQEFVTCAAELCAPVGGCKRDVTAILSADDNGHGCANPRQGADLHATLPQGEWT